MLDDLVGTSGHPPLVREDPYGTLHAALEEPAPRRNGTAGQAAAAVERAAAPLAFRAVRRHAAAHPRRRGSPAVGTDVGEEAAARCLDGQRLGHLLDATGAGARDR
ncbi:hypothetical protein [Streptomyces xiaopingdaonensis]|uniref:hypothetical protein n=1 Tax=Streptomyces xiaopingdaonensis TaxID=1565415 RepID=UPI0012FF29C6|nr:hypothetical protein [Streptomyces xiaopingdaonensis]